MKDHEWTDEGPWPGTIGGRGHKWECIRCGLNVRADAEPRANKSRPEFLEARSPSGWMMLSYSLEPGVMQYVRSDCDISMIMSIMKR